VHALYFAKLVRMEQSNETITQLLVYLKSLTHALDPILYTSPHYYTHYQWSTILTLDRHNSPSCVMSSVSPIHFISLLMTAFQLISGRFLPLLQCKKLITSHLITSTFTLLLLTCPNHLSLFSLNFSSRGATPTRSLITTFLILSSLV